MFAIEHCLRELVAREGSDLHLKVGAPPLYRIHGALEPLTDDAPLTRDDTQQVLRDLLTDPTKLEEYGTQHEVDFSFEIEEVARFRVNAFRQRGSTSLVCRAIPHQIHTIDELNLPDVIRELAEEERGIILLTGTTGSGKSTTLAAIINHINSTMAKHIVTIEDPIEFVHRDKRSVINQREVGMDTMSFKRALRRVLRQDPDVILVGEMRDEETVATALSAAETGHLVLSTVHTVDAAESINRLLDFFPPHQHNQARAMIAGTIKGVVSQRLVPGAGGGRVATCEILRMTGRVRDMIADPALTGKLHEVIAEGEYYGMQTFDQALFHHVKAGRVRLEDAMRFATSPHDFKLLVSADGRRGTTMDEVAETRGDQSGPASRRPAVGAPRPGPPPGARPVPALPANGRPPSAPQGGPVPQPRQPPRPLQPIAAAPATAAPAGVSAPAGAPGSSAVPPAPPARPVSAPPPASTPAAAPASLARGDHAEAPAAGPGAPSVFAPAPPPATASGPGEPSPPSSPSGPGAPVPSAPSAGPDDGEPDVAGVSWLMGEPPAGS
jgi:twitching motility protein PilT